jgi:phenylacetaldehyde dehydrogenase
VYDQVVEQLTVHSENLKIGAGLVPGVFMGPLVNEAQQRRVAKHLEQARANGCEIITGTEVDTSRGYFASPTIVTGAERQHAITREEIFGPVLSVYRFDDADEVVTKANDTEYGLAATIWSTNLNTVNRVSRQLDCGKVIVNHAGFPYPGLSEGGRKASGHGRDLGREGIEACLQTKSILMAI